MILRHVIRSFIVIAVVTSVCYGQTKTKVGQLVPFKKGVAKKIGGGSTNNAVYWNPASINSYEAANVLGYGAARGNLNHRDYWRDGKVITEKFERFIGWYKHGVQPLLLFNHYPKKDDPVGGYDKWYAIGKAFAEKFRPNSDFLLSKGIKDWGITDFMAFNEPEWHIIRHPGTMSAAEYKQALKGLADGVHAVDPTLNVSPGGYTFPLWENVLKDLPNVEVLQLVKAIAPLYNDGTLHALYLHPYVRKGEFLKSRSAQKIFDNTKKAFNIARDIHFAVLEYCYAGSYVVNGQKDDTAGIDENANTAEFYGEASEQEKAIGQMAAFWDNMTVTGNKGQPVSDYVLAWEPLSTYLNNLNWGLAKNKAPYEGRMAANIIQLNTFLTNGMTFTSIDRENEIYTLEGNGNKLIVWQNLDGWSPLAGESFTIANIPTNSKRLDVFDALAWESGRGFSGRPKPVQQHNLSAMRSIVVKGLEKGRTYLFMLWDNEVKHLAPLISMKEEIKKGTVHITGNVKTEVGILANRMYNGAHLIVELPTTEDIDYIWEKPPPGLNRIRITTMDKNGLLNTTERELKILHRDNKLLAAIADTYIRGHHKRYSQKNFNAMNVLEAKTGGEKAIRYPYLKFDLKNAPKVFKQCLLRLKVNENSDFVNNKCIAFGIKDDSWHEHTITWDIAPEKDAHLGTSPVPAPGEWIVFDVTQFVREQINGDGKVSFRLEKPNRTYVSFYSRESHPLNVPILIFE